MRTVVMLEDLRVSAAVCMLAVLAATGCGSSGGGSAQPVTGDVADGRAVYEEPLQDGNSFACATCHALAEPAADGVRRPGHPIGDATRRSRWKNGRAATFLDAANSCVTEWMGATAWTASDPHFIAIRSFLDAQAPASSAANVSFEIVQPPVVVSGGDAIRGGALFDQTCVVCHGSGGTGTIRGPSVAGSKRDPGYIASRVRTSGRSTSSVYDGLTGGVMPFWAKDRLSDDELRDLIAFLAVPVEANGSGGASSNGAAGGGNAAGADGDAAGGSGGGGANGGAGGAPEIPNTSGCAKTHSHVGWQADLGINTGEGQVRGLVTVVDDCTLELSGFSYDGNGIDVRVYGSKTNTFKPGFSIGPDLVGHTYVNQTLRVTLPTDKTLDDLDWVSIWCTAVGANFGSGPFKSP